MNNQLKISGFFLPLIICSIIFFPSCKKSTGPTIPVVTKTVPIVSTTIVTNITQTTASTGGNVTADGNASITSKGVCWSISTIPTIANFKTSDGAGIGSFSSNLTQLVANTNYYVRAYATNIVGTGYGNQVLFTTTGQPVIPTVATSVVTSITSTTAVSGGNITSDGGSAVTVRGVCWSINAFPTISNSKTTDGPGTGVFTSNLTSLNGSTTYHVRAYATNSVGTAYGNDISFTTTVALTPPVAPTNLIVVAGTPSSCNLTWQDNSSNETGFEIQRQVVANSSTWETITTTAASVQSYYHSGLNETWPGYRIRAVNSAGQSGWTTISFAPRILRIINDLYEQTVNGNNWRTLNTIIRVRIGPTQSSVTTTTSYEKFNTNDSQANIGNSLGPIYNSTTSYYDFPIDSGLSNPYWIYVQCGWWEWNVTFWEWMIHTSQVNCTNGTCCCYKYVYASLTHSAGFMVLKTHQDLGFPYGSWDGSFN